MTATEEVENTRTQGATTLARASTVRGGAFGRTLVRHAVYALVAIVVLIVLTSALAGTGNTFLNYQLAMVCAYLCATAGLTFLTGINGQLSLGHGALMATGAYGAALTIRALADRGIEAVWAVFVALLVGVLAALVVGAVIGAAAARLRGPYLAGVTTVIAIVVPAITTTFDGIFKGDQGLSFVTPSPGAVPALLSNEEWQAYLGIGCAVLVMFLLANLISSRFGRQFRAVANDEVAAKLSGINIARTQVLAFVVSAGCAGLGGALMAAITQQAAPGAYSLTLSLYLLMAIVIGGLGSLAGAVWGALLLVALPDLSTRITDSLELSPDLAQKLDGNLALAIFGLFLIIVMIVAPGGIQGLVRRLSGRLSARRRSAGS
ncbi:branched-chain amino acid ABC transporter permease [Virgisporangium aliadipatigenens]|uniref:Branched-chain amino acid ABC transporter permease n=1 Tax=Virgisporangium aliadipatigenens TaxID=741659 RepID=A0A8J4DRL4_9ACTN|nr:branched-chain amino acid ABC transporter permease [Virgisporangium aliadipatigenens]GIJ46903.1 branched-chain amino acid ABC transporter permease [Virgisporangium aliadipatigenens]